MENTNPTADNITPYGQYHASRFVYINPAPTELKKSTVWLNPRFQKNNKIYVNPNFNIQRNEIKTKTSKVHINPNVIQTSVLPNVSQSRSVHINPSFQNIHVNPKVLQNVPPDMTQHKNVLNKKDEQKTIVLTKNKIIRTPIKRRRSIRTKFKIVKSSSAKSPGQPKFPNVTLNRFKLDKRQFSCLDKSRRKYVYSRKMIDNSKINYSKHKQNCTMKSRSFVNISGIVYKTSPNTLRKTVISTVPLSKTVPDKTKVKSKYKLIRKQIVKSEKRERITATKTRIIRNSKLKSKIPTKKLKKCNIPCIFYQKYGLCKGKETGKCFRKHDPYQIALCTRFLQGACINENCLLSHNVSSEKMPTCKFYLEGLCSKENCPYLHVKISPKAEICRDFLEGFCRKGSECDKRHQLLCPEFEKHGTCLKQRCPYPHGKMVRKYLMNKDIFVKKCSDIPKVVHSRNKSENNEGFDSCTKTKDEKTDGKGTRYYIENNSKDISECNLNTEMPLSKELRPKLGELPSFIPLEEK